ncbi:MAG: c-type cytochrome [Chromatiaceae bacterium]|nr:c-type cytochrome [Chromatiaceae bacterium]MCP5435012.1 c-type cytochrome [Chromatiaceae bacterium]MCW5584544.1 c-type cytochrome [Chromatiales bacterium]HPQ24728.1 c-type cytochrome [Gammaproteobacteria bacterium]
MNLIRLLSGGLAIAAFSVLGTANAAPDGRELYIEHCSACHQMEGQSGIGLPLLNAKLADVSDNYLHSTIRLGRPGRVMPAFQRLSDAQVGAIVKFLRQRSETKEIVYSDEPVAGDAAHGQALYAENCVKCHGADGTGEGPGTGVTTSRERTFLVMPASISNTGFLASAPDQMIRRVIHVGRKSSGMPSFDGKLSETDIDDLVAYVRSFEQQERSVAEIDADERPTHVFESPHDFETTVKNVKAALTGANFRIFPDRLLEQGLTDEFSVNTRQVGVRFCNFNVLYGMLKIEPRLGVVLPCRITIMEREGGEVILVVPNLRVISRWFNNDELVGLWDRMEETFTNIIDEATL